MCIALILAGDPNADCWLWWKVIYGTQLYKFPKMWQLGFLLLHVLCKTTCVIQYIYMSHKGGFRPCLYLLGTTSHWYFSDTCHIYMAMAIPTMSDNAWVTEFGPWVNKVALQRENLGRDSLKKYVIFSGIYLGCGHQRCFKATLVILKNTIVMAVSLGWFLKLEFGQFSGDAAIVHGHISVKSIS